MQQSCCGLYGFVEFPFFSQSNLNTGLCTYSDLTTSLAAVILVAAIAIDPFAQQILQYYSCNRPDAKSYGAIPRASSFEVAGTHITQRASSQAMDPGMLASIASGFLDTTEKSSIVPATCATGNCTFANFQSIGICTKCRDATSSVQSSCTGRSIIHNFTGTDLTITGFQVPPGVLAGFGQEALITSNTLSDWSFDGVDTIGGINVLTLTNNNAGRPMPKTIEVNGSNTALNYCSPQGVLAAECGLYHCISTYKATYENVIFNEDLIASEPILAVRGNGKGGWRNYKNASSSWTPTWPGPSCFGVIKPSCLTESQRKNISAKFGNTLSETATEWTPFCDAAGFNISPDCYFEMTQQVYWMIAGYFASTLGSVSADSNQIFDGAVKAQNLSTSWETISGSAFLQNLYQSGNISFASFATQMNRTANSMTAFMRQNGRQGHEHYAKGKLFNTTTCIDVRWGWLALPAVLALLTIIVLCATMYASSSKRGSAVWKSSSLADLFHGLAMKEKLSSDLDSSSGMEQAAKTINVILDDSAGGYQLAVVKDINQ